MTAPAPPRATGVLAPTCAAEWSRLWTVRGSWWFLAAAAVVMLGLGAIAGFDAAADPVPTDGEAAWLASPVSAMPAQFALLALALGAVTSDYATGGIVPTLQWTPRRGVLLRNTAGGLVSLFLVMLVLPILLPQFGYAWTDALAHVLPGSGAAYLLLGEVSGMTRASSVLTLLGWAGGALLLGWQRLVRDDATR